METDENAREEEIGQSDDEKSNVDNLLKNEKTNRKRKPMPNINRVRDRDPKDRIATR